MLRVGENGTKKIEEVAVENERWDGWAVMLRL